MHQKMKKIFALCSLSSNEGRQTITKVGYKLVISWKNYIDIRMG